MSEAQTFLDLFNQLEQILDKLNQSTRHYGFRRLVENLAKDNKIIDDHKLELIEYNELRNAIVHKSTGEPIAQPNAEVIAQMRKILELLNEPPTVMSIAAAPVYTCTTQTVLLDVIIQMNENFYTSIPVYHDNVFVGVLSDNSITRWLAKNGENVNLKNTYVSQLQDCFEEPEGKFHAYQFVKETTDVYSIREAFVRFTQEKKRLGAIFITKNGKKTESILGIITPWDLPKIKGSHV